MLFVPPAAINLDTDLAFSYGALIDVSRSLSGQDSFSFGILFNLFRIAPGVESTQLRSRTIYRVSYRRLSFHGFDNVRRYVKLNCSICGQEWLWYKFRLIYNRINRPVVQVCLNKWRPSFASEKPFDGDWKIVQSLSLVIKALAKSAIYRH